MSTVYLPTLIGLQTFLYALMRLLGTYHEHSNKSVINNKYR